MMEKRQRAICLCCCALCLAACSGVSGPENRAAIGPESELSISPSKAGVSAFEEIAGFIADGDECYNITPDFVADHSDFQIFKYRNFTNSFILYDSKHYSIGACIGGYGITSMALADLNRDSQYELYYTFSWGSGIPRAQIGYFDPASKEVTVFDYSCFFHELMLTVNEAGDLWVNTAKLDLDSPVDFSIESQELIGAIVFDAGKITLDIDQQEGVDN